MTTLFTFGPSHFCEKARWSLDLCGLEYREVRWAPGPHLLAARRLASGTTVPIVSCAEATIQGSREIMDWLEAGGRAGWQPKLSPPDREEIVRLEVRADQGAGVAVRRLIYAASLSNEGRAVAGQLFAGVERRQRALARLMWPVTRRLMMKGMQASAGDVPDATASLQRELDFWDDLLRARGDFLVGERLSRADVTLASLLSPLANPPEHPVYRDRVPWPAYRRILEEVRERPSVLWTSSVYRRFRQGPDQAGATRPSSAST